MITQKLFKYSFENLTFTTPEGLTSAETFVLRVKLERPTSRERVEILSLDGSVSLSTRILNKERDSASLSSYELAEQYFLEADESGDVAVLEAKINLDQPFGREERDMQLGIPLTEAILASEIYVIFDKLHFRFVVRGELENENFPVGTLHHDSDARLCVNPDLASVEFSSETDKIVRTEYERKLDTPINYYSPYGRNTWAGDCVTFYDDGVYHILYFNDRHHHGNRWGGGAHCFSQLTTTDFVDWVDHGPLFELEEQWHSVGTGTMFKCGGKCYFAFGFHTDRVVPRELTCRAELESYFAEHGKMPLLGYDELFAAGKYPCGTNLAVSDDGIKFRLMNVVCHGGENPSVYPEDGGLVMFSGYGGAGTWRAKDVNSQWELVDRSFPPSGDTPMKNSSECPSYFEWNGYKYLIMGGYGYWRTAKDSDEFYDSAAIGVDVYDGLVYPMAAKVGDRVMYAGWINGIGWGSVIVQRELLQLEDGRLGIRWIPEITAHGELLYDGEARECELDESGSYYYEFDVNPDKNGSFALRFGEECELRLDFARETAQYGDIGGEEIPSARFRIAADGARASDTHYHTRNYSLEQVDVMREPFRLRVIQHSSPKMGCVLIDAEIAGKRTMLTCRRGAKLAKIVPVCSGGTAVARMCVYRHFGERR